MGIPLLMRIMSLSINTAKRAGSIIREVMHKGNLGIVEKAKDDLQTEADRKAQRCIIASLQKEFPNVYIIGEEGPSDLNVPEDLLVTDTDLDFLKKTCPEELANIDAEECIVWVDPLDGTSEYTQGFLEHVTVLIGIAVKNSAIGGIIHQPYYKHSTGELGRTIWGLKGLGTGGFHHETLPQEQLIITTTRSHSNPIVQNALDSLSPTEIVRVGGAGYKVIQLLEGKAHAYVYARAGCKKWDTCAPEAVLEAHGGILTDMFGEHYAYHKDVQHANEKGVLAAVDKSLHRELLNKIPQGVRDALQ